MPTVSWTLLAEFRQITFFMCEKSCGLFFFFLKGIKWKSFHHCFHSLGVKCTKIFLFFPAKCFFNWKCQDVEIRILHRNKTGKFSYSESNCHQNHGLTYGGQGRCSFCSLSCLPEEKATMMCLALPVCAPTFSKLWWSPSLPSVGRDSFFQPRLHSAFHTL